MLSLRRNDNSPQRSRLTLSRRGDCTRDALSIFMDGSADINLISKQIFHESKRIEKIINKNMVIFAYQGSSKIADNAVSKSLFKITIALFSRVDLQIANEAIQRICTLPHFDSPLHRFKGHVLFKGKSSFKRNQCLVDRNIFRRPVLAFNSLYNRIEKRSHFEQFVMVCVPTWQFSSLLV